MTLKDHLSPATANRCLAVLRIMLREAQRQGLIVANPVAEVQQLRETPSERGILTLDEARELFDENKFSQYWQSEIAYAANLLSATTGMRLGEVLALRRALRFHQTTASRPFMTRQLRANFTQPWNE